ncbi:MAG: AMP-binding protein [Candidatus Gastranaerophilaceae bacterium]
MNYETLFDIWKRSAELYPERIALSDVSGLTKISFKVAFNEICCIAEFFKRKNIIKGDKVCIFAENSPHWLLLEQASICLGAISVAKSSQKSLDELDYVYNDSESNVFICDKPDVINFFVEKYPDFLTRNKVIIYTGTDEQYRKNDKIFYFEDILKDFCPDKIYFNDFNNKPDDLCYIHYTSGTSSSPKGAMLTNYGMAYSVDEMHNFLKDFNPKTFVASFPLASAGGKTLNLYAVSKGCTIYYTPYSNYFEAIEKIQPDLLHCAPKIMITMYGKFMEYIHSRGEQFEKFFNFNYEIALKLIKIQRFFYSKRQTNITPNGINGFCEKILNSIRKIQHYLVFKQIKNSILKDDTLICVGSASLAKQAEDFFNVIGVDIAQHYGMTETTGLTTQATVQDQKERPYTCGVFFSKTQFKIVNPETKEPVQPNEAGLLMLKGPNILKGYFNKPEATKKALTSDDWFITGDLAYYTKDNYIGILSRYDDVIVMMNGYNVYAPLLQDQVGSSKYVQQNVVAGQGKPYLCGLVVPNREEYLNWCKESNRFIYENLNEDKQFKEFLLNELNCLISKKKCHQYFEKLKYLYFLDKEFSIEDGTLTDTFKIKYRKICDMYKNEIDNLYK